MIRKGAFGLFEISRFDLDISSKHNYSATQLKINNTLCMKQNEVKKKPHLKIYVIPMLTMGIDLLMQSNFGFSSLALSSSKCQLPVVMVVTAWENRHGLGVFRHLVAKSGMMFEVVFFATLFLA